MAELPQVLASGEAISQVACDALVVGAFSSAGGIELTDQARSIDEALGGGLEEHLQGSSFKSALGDLAIVPTFGRIPAKAVAVVGLGDRGELATGPLRKATGAAARRLRERTTIAVALGLDHDGMAEAATEGLLLGAYQFARYKSEGEKGKLGRILVLGAEADAIERGSVLAEATWTARDLTNEPPSKLTPEILATRAHEIADVSGIDCEIWDESRLQDEGFGGLLGVASGSHVPPRFISLHYAPTNAARKVAIIGKGITYDSGGLSLKDAANMETMKTDMAGAAAVIAAMGAIGRLQPNIEVLGFVPATENMPSGTAIKPGDVITHYGGRTTEVLNTDAEGRLVLADAIAYASEQGVEAIVDVATLTGSIMVALGKKATGLFSNDDSLIQELRDASERAGERLWPMPLFDDYKKELESDIADMKNVGSRWGGAIIAALFLREFVGDGIAWAHLDIAGAARADSDYEEKAKGATGVAARTLVTWIEDRAG